MTATGTAAPPTTGWFTLAASERVPLLSTSSRPSQTPSSPSCRSTGWWLTLAALWGLATAGDRIWLHFDGRLPSWDQADYLNSAVDHGRALGLLPGGGWSGWNALLDLSPKIPPLASLVNGTVMALAGDGPDQASWALAIWHALLLVVVACWGRDLAGKGFGLLAAVLLVCVPALAGLRVDYTLDLPLTATTTLALWRLGRWQAPRLGGGGWGQTLAAALAVTASVLVKQSALLVVAVPALWAAAQALGWPDRPGRRLQVLAALTIVLGLCAPWLRHNWITTIGGTNRAVLESAAAEGDPAVLSFASLLWYPLRWPRQLGPVLLPALGAALLAAWEQRRILPLGLRHPLAQLPPGWPWLIGCAISGWLCTSLSPNKDPRYIAPVLPLLVLLLTAGWWQIGRWLRQRGGRTVALAGLGAGLLSVGSAVLGERAAAVQPAGPSPLPAAIATLRQATANAPTTLLVVPGSPELNEQTVTLFGRQRGGQILGRRLGRQRREHPLVLARSEWILLATGDQGTNRPFSKELSYRVRSDGRFQMVDSWPWSEGRRVELWQRRGGADSPRQAARPFDAEFIHLARGMERGPAGIARVFERIGAEHQLDGHFLYQERVRTWAEQRLAQNPADPDALWSMGLITTLRNRPAQAQQWFGRLQALEPDNPWPGAYQAVVLLAGWNPWQAEQVLEAMPPASREQPVVKALRDLSLAVSGHPPALFRLRESLPKAIGAVKHSLEP